MSSEQDRLLDEEENRQESNANVTSSSRYLGGSSTNNLSQHHNSASVEDVNQHHTVPGNFDIENNPDIDQSFQKTTDYTIFNQRSKVFLNMILFINTLWLVFTFISDFFFEINFFFSNPNRIASFIDINLITIAIIANFLSLWFNYMQYYSSVDEKLNFISSGIILFNFLLYLSVEYNRERLGPIGKLTFIWCFASFLISGLIDYQLSNYIKPLLGIFDHADGGNYGSTHVRNENSTANPVVVDPNIDSAESQIHTENVASDTDTADLRRHVPTRKTDHEGIRHTLTEWSVIFFRNTLKIVLLLWLVIFTINNLLYSIDVHRIMKHIDQKVGPQQLTESQESVDGRSMSTDYSTTVDGFFWNDLQSPSYKLHVTCYGNLSDYNIPLVIYEHGSVDTAYSSGNWIKEMHNFQKLDKYCVYERPGFGVSDSAPSPVSIGLITESFKNILLEQILPNFTDDAKPDITLVGYDIGGLYAQVLCSKLSTCNRLMLVESWHEDLLKLKTWLPKDGIDKTTLKELGKWNSFKTWLFGVFESSLGLPLMKSLIVNKSGSLDRVSGDFMKYQGKYLRGRFQEGLTSGIISYNEVIDSRLAFHNRIQLSIVSSKDMISKNVLWGDWQRSFAKLSRSTREWEIVNADHFLYESVNGKKTLQDVLYRLVFE